MVVPTNETTKHPRRPSWSRGGSWRKYVRTSNRKLQQQPSLEQQESVPEKHARFEEMPVIHEVLVAPPTDEEVQTRWHRSSDYELFDRDRQLTALQYRALRNRGEQFQETEHSLRGLEDILDGNLGSASRQATRAAHTQCVLEEQKRQRESGLSNRFMLRDVSAKSSKESKKKSAALGEADALSGHVTTSKAVQRQMSGMVHSISRKLVLQ